MILAIDIGNTNIAIGCIDGDDVSNVFFLSTITAKTADEYAVDLKNLLEFHSFSTKTISGAIISCVVPPLTEVVRKAIMLLAGVEPIVVGAGVKTGMNILIDDPAQLGGDMVATAVGALAKYPPPLIIIDLGTAINICVIDRKGSFIGGAIAPGVSLSMNALSAGTSQLPTVQIEAPAKCISANTIDCMKSGAVFGTASMIDGMAKRIEVELSDKATVIATGGHAAIICEHCSRDVIYDPNLVLHGLGAIYKKNTRP